MAKQVAEVFVETLVAAGVKRVYGVVGDSLNGITETIRKNPASISSQQAFGFTLYMARAVLSGRGDEIIDLVKTNLFR